MRLIDYILNRISFPHEANFSLPQRMLTEIFVTLVLEYSWALWYISTWDRTQTTYTSKIVLHTSCSTLTYSSYNVADPDQVVQGLGVPHVSELSAIWGPDNTNGAAPASYKTINAAIVPVVQGYWTSFVRSFNPNTHRLPGSPLWKPFSSSQRRILFETNNTRMETVTKDQASRCSILHTFSGVLQQ